MKRLHIIYSGRVHGVGFRFMAERVAADLGLNGWVRNNRDASVEIVCEGPEEDLNEFIRRIEGSFSGYIKDKDVDWSEATGEFKDFSVRFFFRSM